MKRFVLVALGVIVSALSSPRKLQADWISLVSPGESTEAGAKIRWGGSGFEASIRNVSPAGPTLNPGGAPVWSLNDAYKFELGFSSTNGTVGLALDFNRNGTFDTGERISNSNFGSSLVGLGFREISISGNESGSTARSNISNLTIDGGSFPDIAPNGGFTEQFYQSAIFDGDIKIAGDITFITAGTNQERPSFNFNFRGSGPVGVPEPTAGLALSLALGALALRRRR